MEAGPGLVVAGDAAERPGSAAFAGRVLGVCSAGIWRIPHLRAFLPEAAAIVRVGWRWPRAADMVVGWGLKPSSLRARQLAARRGLRYLALEDGFIRSLGPAADGFAPHGLVVDDLGIYYDATRPSRLERILETEDLRPWLAEAGHVIATIRRERLAKATAAPELAPGALTTGGKPLVLVIDQTAGDMSIELGLAGERQFHDLLDAAIDENPGAQVMVKLHPEVIAGRRRGHLAARARRLGVPVIACDLNPIALAEQALRVYVVTSQAGMDALIAGVPVTCFGLPFYAGWGATDDRVHSARRTRRRSVEEIVAAAYLRYGRYVDPITGQACPLGRLLQRLTVMKRADERHRGPTVALGFARWKRHQLRPFLATTDGELRFAASAETALAEAARSGARLCCWAAREPPGLAARAAAAGVPLVRVEDGFLRSIGLGSDLLPAASLVFDERGIYYDPARPSALEAILEAGGFDAATLAAARRLRQRLIGAGLSKYNTGHDRVGPIPDRRPRILVPGQVEDDASVRLGGGAIQSNLGLLRAVRAERPEACILFKPHPDVESGNRRGAVAPSAALRLADHVLAGIDAVAAIAAADEVHTLTSLLGFEALLRGVPVVTHGAPFYAGWGLTTDRLALPRRTRRLTLDELVAGALLLYPAYVDPVTGLACDAETVAWRLASEARRREAWRPARAPWLRQLRRGLRALHLAATPAR